MTKTTLQLAVEEGKARANGDTAKADALQLRRWELAMGLVVNSENTELEKTND